MAAITDRTLAALVSALYAGPGNSNVRWHYLDKGDDDNDIYWGAVWFGSILVVVFRGSADLDDWARDIAAMPWPFASIGPVHWGFSIGIRAVADRIFKIALGRPIIVCGHSLGAAHATIGASYLTIAGNRPLARICWGEPRPGFAKLAQTVSGIKHSRSYRNTYAGKLDPVTLVPWNFGPFHYQHVTPPINVSAKPITSGPLALHDFRLYESATPPTIIS